MSYILDALTKSQRQRREAPAPTLDTPQLMAPSAKRSRGGQGVAVALGSVGVALGIYLLVSEPREPAPSTASTSGVRSAGIGDPAGPSPLAARVADRPEPTEQRGQGQGRSQREAPTTSASRASPPAYTPPGNVAPVKNTATAVAGRETAAAAGDAVGGIGTRAVRETAPGRSPAAPAPVLSETGLAGRDAAPLGEASSASRQLLMEMLARQRQLDAESRAHSATRGTATDPGNQLALASNGAPAARSETPAASPDMPPEKTPLRLFELPEALQETALSLRINAHVYAEIPSDRMVIINMSRYREGEQIKEGPRIDAITSTGAILSYQSERFYLGTR